MTSFVTTMFRIAMMGAPTFRRISLGINAR